MTRVFVGLMLALALVATPYTVKMTVDAGGAPRFPWARYADVPPIQSMEPSCEGTAAFIIINDEWSVLSTDAKDLFVHRTKGVIDYAYLAVGTNSDGRIQIRQVLTVEEAMRRYPDPCAYFTEKEA
jgi:hypothetical protein